MTPGFTETGTLVSIAWLAQSPGKTGRIRHGLVLSCMGDSGGFVCKRTVDRVNVSDGDYSLLDIAERASLPVAVIRNALAALIEKDFLVEVMQ